MDSIKNSISRIHPLMAAAAVSVVIVSLAGTAAITGMLPSSHGAPDQSSMTNAQLAAQAQAQSGQIAPVYGTTNGAAYGTNYATTAQQPGMQTVQPAYGQQAYGQQYVAGQPGMAQTAQAQQPVVIEKTIIREVPAKTTHTVHHHTTSYARNDGYYAPAARPAPQPNYMAIGTGAVVGGLLGNQVGGGNGRKLATVAGVIGGGLLGNQIANQR
jgi:hypothetical protein